MDILCTIIIFSALGYVLYYTDYLILIIITFVQASRRNKVRRRELERIFKDNREYRARKMKDLI